MFFEIREFRNVTVASPVAQIARVAYRDACREEVAVTVVGMLRIIIVGADSNIRAELESVLLRVGVREVDVRSDSGEHAPSEPGLVDVAFLDARLPSERARYWFQALPGTTRVVVLGSGASRAEVFRLAQEGAHDYLEPPFADEDIRRCVAEKPDRERRLRGVARCLVGEVSLKDAQQRVRVAMLDEALQACCGSRRSAARLLGVTRPAVQRMLRERPLKLPD